MALFNALLPSASSDVVAVLNSETNQPIFNDARPMRATVSESAQLMTHPLEDGANIVDHRILLPIGISIPFILTPDTFRQTYQEIRDVFRRSTRLTVQTKTATYSNMYLQNMPHEEDPALFDTITIVLEFIEAMFTRVQIQALPPASVRNPADASTVDRGQVSGSESGNRGGVLFRLFSS